jgi:hypothetical protein
LKSDWWYALACVFVPAIWGIAVGRIYEMVAVRKAKRGEVEPDETEMYYI